ncbi:hypothetical protein Q5752_006827 [Cryptotrichosporon argae]
MDPLSPLTAPPPRYLLESDSSDEEGQGQYPSSSRSRAAPVVHKAEVVPLAPLEAQHVVVAVGQLGRYLLRRVSIGRKVLDVTVDGKCIGSGFDSEDAVLVLVNEGSNDTTFDIAKTLLSLGEEKKWTVLTSYVPSMYIPDPSAPSLPDPPVRLLSHKASSLPSFDAPNYLSGLPAALLALAAHPTSSISVSALAAPLPLSSLAAPALPDALAALGIPLKLGRASWDEEEDEPFVGFGMGARRLPPGPAARVELGSMYM